MAECDFCKKEGFPIMPMRYTIAPGSVKEIPSLATDMNVSIPIKGGDMKYSVRTLRSGYLYVFDEKHKRWYAYIVTPKGYFCSFPIDKAAPASVSDPEKHDKPCINQPDRMARSAFITVPATASTIWLTFSDAEWTAAVKKRHDDAKYRQAHMQSFNVSGWIANQKASHAVPITQLKTTVAEYSTNGLKLGKSFGFCPAGWFSHPSDNKDKVDRAKALVDAATALFSKSKGAILALQDPCGVTQDIAALMQARIDTHVIKENQWPLAISSTIQQLEQAVKNDAELRLINERESSAQTAERGRTIPGPGDIYIPPNKKRAEDLRKITEKQLDETASNAWKKYRGKYSESERQAWEKEFKGRAKTFDQNVIIPMASLHVAWMKSTRFASAFLSNYDENDLDSGLIYTRSLTLCIAGTQDKKACFDYYYQSLEKNNINDTNNLILRALVLNQQGLSTKITEATKKGASISLATFPWDNLVNAFSNAVEKHLQGTSDVLGRFLASMSGPFVKLIQTAAEGKAVYAGLISLGVVTKRPVVQVTLTGSKKAFRRLLVRQLLAQTGSDAKFSNKMDKAVADEMRRMKIRGIPTDGDELPKTYMLVIDAEDMPQFKGMPASKQAAEAVKRLRTPEDIDKLNSASWKRKVAIGAKALPQLLFGMVSGLFQVAGFIKLNEDLDKAMSNRKTEAEWRRGAGAMAFSGTFADLVGKGIEKWAPVVLHRGSNATQIVTKTFVKYTGRILGGFATVIMVAWDSTNAVEAAQKGQIGMAFLYGSSAVLGVVTCYVLVFTSWTGIGAILAVLCIAIAILIEMIKDNPLQEWLERCYFGNKKYPSLPKEMQELEVALKG